MASTGNNKLIAPPRVQALNYSQHLMEIIQALRTLRLYPQAVNPGDGSAGNLWFNSTNSHFYNGPVDLQAGGGGGGGGQPIEVLDVTRNFNDSGSISPISVSCRLTRELMDNNEYLVHFEIDPNVGPKINTRYYEAVGIIPPAYRSPRVGFSTHTFTTVTGLTGLDFDYDSDILGLIQINHTTGTVRIYKEGNPGTGVWTGLISGWQNLVITWTTSPEEIP